MKKLILQEFMSADGFCADRNKTTGFFDGTYHSTGNDINAYQETLLDSVDLILLGTNTYKMFTGYWPVATAEDGKIADAMNRIPKVVFSSSLNEVRWGDHENISLVAHDAVTYVKSLKEAKDKNMIMWGSLSLAQSLLKANLFDEIQLVILPVAIGQGYRLFPDESKLLPLTLTGHEVFDGGTVLHRYESQPSLE